MKRSANEQSSDEEQQAKKKQRCLADIFGAPPLSVLDPRQQYWKKEKKRWLDKGIQSEIGRGENALKLSKLMQVKQKGTSVFDPFLVELVIRWYSKEKDVVFDPFAGGSVRGIVTSALRRKYIGYELRKEQVKANKAQRHISEHPKRVKWHCADSSVKDPPRCQLVFTCPPYLDMEKYSDDPADLSTMATVTFFRTFRRIIKKAVKALDENCFLVLMLGNVRQNGTLVRFPEKTAMMLNKLGMEYHNELIYLQEPATAAMRAFNAMNNSRLAGSVHQKLLVFCKGSAKEASKRLGAFKD